MENRASNRAEQLQFLRFLAFCLVFIWHADKWKFGFSTGGIGAACAVSFFFMLSGLVTAWSHFDDEIAVTPGAIGGYMWRKLKRLYPLYIFSMLFAMAYSGIPGYVALKRWDALKEPLTLLLRNALMIQSWFPEEYFSFNGTGWYVSTIMFLYLLTLPMLKLLLKLRQTKRPVLGYCACAILLGLAATLHGYLMRNTATEFTLYVFPLARMWEYAAGMCLGCLARLLKPRVKGGRALFTLMEIATLALWIYGPYHDSPAWVMPTVRWLLPNAILLLTYALGEGLVSRLFRARPLAGLGNLTFECFLLHTNILSLYASCVADKQVAQAGNVFRQPRRAAQAAAQISAQGRAFNLLFCLAVTLLLARLIHGAAKKKSAK